MDKFRLTMYHEGGTYNISPAFKTYKELVDWIKEQNIESPIKTYPIYDFE